MTQPDSTAQHSQIVGQLAEKLVARWLCQQGWTILYERWHCRWGELDLIAQPPAGSGSPMLVFVEVKARGDRNWDNDGLLAVTPQKQSKLWKTAELFLATYPTGADQECRFDVVLVKVALAPRRAGWKPLPLSAMDEAIAQLPTIEIGKPIKIPGYSFTLQQHLAGVFT